MIDPWFAFVAIRALNFAAAMLLFGGITFTVFVAPKALALELRQRFRFGAILIVVVALVTTISWLPAQAATINETWSSSGGPTAMELSTQTEFGRIWILRVLTALCLAIAVVLQGLTKTTSILAAMLLSGLSLAGHAAMHTGLPGIAHRASQAMHLLSAGFWIGSLLPIAVITTFLSDPYLRAPTAEALRRFSFVAQIAVAIVVATGLINTWLVVGARAINFESAYQYHLALKIGAVAGMIGLAALNRLRLTPRALTGDGKSILLFRASVIAEIILAGLVLALVAEFATLDPGH